MTHIPDEVVALAARSLCERQIRQARRWDTSPADLEALLPDSVDYSWTDHIEDARAALSASGLMEVVQEAAFLCARVRELEGSLGDAEQTAEDYSGHVTPSLARLGMLVAPFNLDQGGERSA